MLTVACVLVNGHVPYTPDYVARLARMVKRGLGETPYRMVCLTDQPDAMPDGVTPIKIAPVPGVRAWWSKLQLFNPAHGFQGRVLYLDLDVLVVGDLNLIADYPAWFATIPDGAPNFKPSNGLRVVHCYNTSVMVWTAGVVDDVYTAWSPPCSELFWGDQDWIGAIRPNLAKMPLEWFPRLSEIDTATPKWSENARVILAKKPKNAQAARQWPWFAELWG